MEDPPHSLNVRWVVLFSEIHIILIIFFKVDLFSDWVVAWSDDQKNYFIIRLKDIDAGFSSKYEHFLEFGKDSPEKDYFEPGVPEGLDFSSLSTSKESREVPQPKKISFMTDEETRDQESALRYDEIFSIELET